MKRRLKIIKLTNSAAGFVALLAPLVLSGQIVSAQTGTTDMRQPIIGGDAPQAPVGDAEPTEFAQGPLFPYSLLDQALAGNVEPDGSVQYANLKGNKKLGWFLKAVATADLNQFPVFTFAENDPATGRPTIQKKDRTPELIFWINAYNAHVLNAIAQAYPVKTIDTIKDFDTAQTRTVAGKNYSFKEMREKILGFGDPRALFSLTTGTWGGFLPSPTAVRYVEYDNRMNAAISSFINDPRNVSINRLQGLVTVNSTLEDLSNNFKVSKHQKFEGIRYLLSAYTDGNGRGYFSAGSYRIDFKKADRALNDKTMRGDNS